MTGSQSSAGRISYNEIPLEVDVAEANRRLKKVSCGGLAMQFLGGSHHKYVQSMMDDLQLRRMRKVRVGQVADGKLQDRAGVDGKKNDIFLLDVRERDEYEFCRLDGSTLIPLSQMKERYDEVPKDKEVLVYCHHGMRSMQVDLAPYNSQAAPIQRMMANEVSFALAPGWQVFRSLRTLNPKP